MSGSIDTSDLLAGAGGAAAGGGTLFQQQVGAWVCSWMLAEMPLDPVFDLGGDRPLWVRLESDAPVDDVMIATKQGGFIAMQLKRTLSASSSETSEFGKTINQFVRHWFVCSTGQKNMDWDRPLEYGSDRLVLVVGPESSSTIRTDLVSGLRHRRSPAQAQLTQDQADVLEKFDRCVAAAWRSLSSEPQPQALLTDLYKMVRVITFNPDDQKATANLQSGEVSPSNASVIANLLVVQCGKYIAQRSGADTPTLRRELLDLGASLPHQPSFRSDISKLQKHSARVESNLKSYEVIDAGTGPVSVPRECQATVNEAARQDSLLIVGEPGVGKSAVLNTLATNLRQQGCDVIQLAVDEYSIETLEGLQRMLRLDHSLTEVIEAWDGQERAWLIIDALDASRGGKTAAVFRGLLANIQRMNGRWIVVASIRSFDLQMGTQYRTLFSGKPPTDTYADRRFDGVRHVVVPSWTSGEFEHVLKLVPPLLRAVDAGGAKLREVAMIPFNARLLCDLIAKSPETFDSSAVGTRLELLRAYWTERVDSLGITGEVCLAGLVRRMVSRQSLRVSKLELSANETPEALENLLKEGVIRQAQSSRYVEFSHHLLFDYAISRVYIDLDQIASNPELLAKEKASGLMLAPGMVIALQDRWLDLNDRNVWWSAAITLISGEQIDPIIRSVVSRVAADLPSLRDDFNPLIAALDADGQRPAHALSNIVGAFVVRLEDGADASLAPWTSLARNLTQKLDLAEWPLRVLCHQLVTRSTSPEFRSDIGTASRALLRYGLTLEDPRSTVNAAISFVADTYTTDVAASRELLRSVLHEERFERFAQAEIPAIARKIEPIVEADPSFAIIIYQHVYAKDLANDRPTSLGDSRILPLRSTAKQDFELAKYHLNQFFPKLLTDHTEIAIDALLGAYQGFVDREHAPSTPAQIAEVEVGGHTYRLQNDYSEIWASDTEGTYAKDADALLAHLWKMWQKVPEDLALAIASQLTRKGHFAVYWARLFMVAERRRGTIAENYWDFATREPFLLCTGTVRSAARLIATLYDSKQIEEKYAFEVSVSAFDYSEFDNPVKAREAFERIIFGAIEKPALVTDYARQAWVDIITEESEQDAWIAQIRKERHPRFHWIEDLDRDLPANAILISAIDEAKSLSDQSTTETAADQALVNHAEAVLKTLVRAINDRNAHPELSEVGLDTLGDATEKVLHRCIRATPSIPSIPESYLQFIELAAQSSRPAVTENTEHDFEENAGWGAPAGRISAAEASFMMASLRPDLYSILKPLQERLLLDHHPAVRMQAAHRLFHLWNMDRDRFWLQAKRVLEHESNTSVVDSFLSGQLQRFQVIARDEVEGLLMDFLSSLPVRRKAFTKVGNRAREILFVMWLRSPNQKLDELVNGWVIERSWENDFLGRLLHLCRDSLTSGMLSADPSFSAHRARGRDFLHSVVLGANRILDEYYSVVEPDSELIARSKIALKLVDDACMQIYFASDGLAKAKPPSTTEEKSARAEFIQEIKPTLDAIGIFAETRTVYYLMQILEGQVDTDPQGMFDLIAGLMLSAGRRSGFQYEQLGADLFVRLVGIYLADHKDIFDDTARRQSLVACLDVFISAGWPSARRLLYHLTDLVQ